MNKYILTYVLLFLYFYISAQSAVLSSGGNAKSTSGSVSYSVGQAFVEPFSNTAISISPGVQQPFEISEIVDTKNVLLPYQIKVFPNPATDHINIMTEDLGINTHLKGVLTHTDSKTVQEFDLNVSAYTLEVHHLPAGIYFLTIFNPKNQRRTFKIVKP